MSFSDFLGGHRATVVESSDELHWKSAESYLSPVDAWFASLRLDHGPYFQHLWYEVVLVAATLQLAFALHETRTLIDSKPHLQ